MPKRWVGWIGGAKPFPCIFAVKLRAMNTQEIIYPIGKFIVWTFENILVPISSPMNMAVVLLGFGGLFFWLRKQKQFTEAAKKNGTLD
jgi:hypothetical protein